jgi:D-alanine transaminase
MIAYFNGNFIKEEKCFVSPYDRGFLFSDGVYEVIKYIGEKFFEFQKHSERLEYGLKELKINFPDTDRINDIGIELLRKNNLLNIPATLYVQITRGISKPRNHIFPAKEIPPTVFISVTQLSADKEKNENGIKIILTEDLRWGRCDIKTTLLLPNVLAQQKAFELGAEEAVLVRNGNVTEGSHTSFAAVKNGKLIFPKQSNYILPGITRKVVIEICRQNKIPVAEQDIRVKDLRMYDEFMIMSTKLDVVSVLQIDDRIINNGKPGGLTKTIQRLFDERCYSIK